MSKCPLCTGTGDINSEYAEVLEMLECEPLTVENYIDEVLWTVKKSRRKHYRKTLELLMYKLKDDRGYGIKVKGGEE